MWRLVACPSGYTSSASGTKSTSAPASSAISVSRASWRGYRARSPASLNCFGLTKMLTTTEAATPRAPRGSAPRALRAAHPSSARSRRRRPAGARRAPAAAPRRSGRSSWTRRLGQHAIERFEVRKIAANGGDVRVDGRAIAARDGPGQIEAVVDGAAHERQQAPRAARRPRATARTAAR